MNDFMTFMGIIAAAAAGTAGLIYLWKRFVDLSRVFRRFAIAILDVLDDEPYPGGATTIHGALRCLSNKLDQILEEIRAINGRVTQLERKDHG